MSTVFDDTYEHFRGVRFGPIEAPFPEVRDNNESIICDHANGLMGMVTDFEDDKLYAVMAMYRRGEERGIYSHFSAEDCRQQARAFTRMAEFIENTSLEEFQAL
jgi:hypothetical protein